MTFYLNMARKYANIRTFGAENGDGAGTETNAEADAAKAAADAAKVAADKAAAEAEAQKAVDDAKAAADAAAAEAAKSNDPNAQKEADEKAVLLREVMDKKEKLKTTSKDLKTAQDALAAYGGVDPEKVKELLRKEVEAERREAEARGDFDRVKAMMADEHKKETDRLSAEITAEREARKSDLALIDELTIGNAFGNSAFIADRLNISVAKTRTLYGGHFERQDGVVVAFDKPAGSKDRTMLVDASGTPLSFEAALERIVDADPDKRGVLKSTVKRGSGSGNDADKGKKEAPKVTGSARIAANLADLD